MGMSLQGELEPLLAKLWQAADSACRAESLSDPTNPAYAKWEQEALTALNEKLSTLVSRFRSYYSLDGNDLSPVADQFAGESDRWESPTGSSVYCTVARASGDVERVSRLIDIGHWQGGGAESFYHNFLDPFKRTAAVHSLCAREMAMGAKSLDSAVELAKESVVWICEDLINRLGGGAPPGPLPGEKGEGFKEQAGFAAIVADTVALFRALTLPESVLFDAVLAAVGAAGGFIAASKMPSHDLHIGVGFSMSAAGLVVNAGISLDRLDKNMSDLDERVAGALETDLGSSGPFGDTFARIQNPHLDPSAYRQLTFKQGDHSEKDAVVVDLTELYYAGYRSLPSAADNYDFGTKVCSAAHIDGAQAQFPRAVGKFNEAAGMFTGLLADVRDDLTRSGEAIVAAATTYGGADEYEAAKIKQLEDEIPALGSFVGAEHYTPPRWLRL
ncbi:hypothetical protein ABZ942_42150 [Nocardia sp. NPDC046473]|uniref:hypothetical protein n=1 Tax=Nocardia sp. NPDC046473 TaxID=3155733 RepID=UPI0033E9352D